MTLLGATPYHNLILTGHMGVSRSAVGRLIARQLGVLFVDLDTEIQAREQMPGDEIRQLYGEARLHAIEGELCRELGLRRGAVLSISGRLCWMRATVSADEQRPVLVLACALNEILRRLYSSQGARFHDPKVRAARSTRFAGSGRFVRFLICRLSTRPPFPSSRLPSRPSRSGGKRNRCILESS